MAWYVKSLPVVVFTPFSMASRTRLYSFSPSRARSAHSLTYLASSSFKISPRIFRGGPSPSYSRV